MRIIPMIHHALTARRLVSVVTGLLLCLAVSTALAEASAAPLKWWQKTSVYQIYPKSFADTCGNGAGDLRGITEHLDHIRDFSCGAIWLTPVYPSPMVDNGYDISDYKGIDPSYGRMDDFETLVKEAGKRDIRIVMDHQRKSLAAGSRRLPDGECIDIIR